MNNFGSLLKVVSDITGIEDGLICSHSKELDIVTARHALIILMFREGFHSSTIARSLGFTCRCINYVLSTHGMCVTLQNILETAEKKLRTNRERHY